MGRLSDALRREQAQDSAKANQRAINQLTHNSEDGSLSKHMDKVRASESRQRMQRAREILGRNPQALENVGVIGVLQDNVPGLTISEAEFVIEEVHPRSQPEPMELGYTGEIERSRW